MMLRERIIEDVNSITNPQQLRQLFDYVQLLKRTSEVPATANREAVLSFAGTLSDAEAAALRQSLRQEFGQVGGEW